MEASALFSIEEPFDVPAALALREKTIAAEAADLVLDFSHAPRIEDTALALLTVNLVSLTRLGHAVELRGLRDHQCKILEHFGVDISLEQRIRIVSDRPAEAGIGPAPSRA